MYFENNINLYIILTNIHYLFCHILLEIRKFSTGYDRKKSYETRQAQFWESQEEFWVDLLVSVH